MKVKDVAKNKGIPIVSFVRTESSRFSSLSYKPLVELQFPHTFPKDMSLNLLWHSTYFFKPYCPSWIVYMQDISHGNLPGKSKITMLPIDLNPSDETCMYSTLMFMINQAARLNITTPCITFDQPLWLKALEIIKLKSLNAVCRLGELHTLMRQICGLFGDV